MPQTVGRVAFAQIEVIAQMPRCRDCHWWEQNAGDRREGIGNCQAISTSPPGEPGKATRLAWNVGGCSMVTKPDFGCVQWKARA